jgi:hypothetical protein
MSIIGVFWLIKAIGTILKRKNSSSAFEPRSYEQGLISDDPYYQDNARRVTSGHLSPQLVRISQSLNITRITNRLISIGMPTNSPSDGRRNNVKELAEFLQSRYHDCYMIWNLTGCFDDSEEDVSYDTAPFHNQIINFPISSKAYQNSLSAIIDICKSIHGWLGLDARNVAIIHCSNSVHKSATAICSYLVFSQIFTNFNDAVAYFRYRKRISPQVKLPVGQMRYLEYFDSILALNGALPNPYPLCIHQVVINGPPVFESRDWTPGIEFYENGQLALSTIPKRRKNVDVDISHSRKSLIFKFSTPLIVERDVQFRFFRHIKTDRVNEIWTIVSFSFHTGFMPTSNVVRVALLNR